MPYLSDLKRKESKKHRTTNPRMTNRAKQPCDLVQIIQAEYWSLFKFKQIYSYKIINTKILQYNIFLDRKTSFKLILIPLPFDLFFKFDYH